MDTPIFDRSIASLLTLNFHAVSMYIFLVLPFKFRSTFNYCRDTFNYCRDMAGPIKICFRHPCFCAPHCTLLFAKMVRSGTGISIWILISLIAKFISSNYINLHFLSSTFCIAMQTPILFTDNFIGVNTEAIEFYAIIFDAVYVTSTLSSSL